MSKICFLIPLNCKIMWWVVVWEQAGGLHGEKRWSILGVLFVLWMLTYCCSICCQFLIFCLSKYIYYAVVGGCLGASGWLAWREKVEYLLFGVLFVLWLIFLKLNMQWWNCSVGAPHNILDTWDALFCVYITF